MKFAYYYQQLFSTEQCAELKSYLKEDAKFFAGADEPAEKAVKTSKVDTISWSRSKQYLSQLESHIHNINRKYFGFDLYPLNDVDAINFNTYSSKNKSEYGWHSDGTYGDTYDIKLTVLANLSTTPYTGGNFELFMSKPDHIDPFDTPGMVLIFPSFLQHRVTPVLTGTRESLAIFMLGPNYK